MKHFMQLKTAILREDDPPPSSSNPSFYAARNRSSLKPKSSSSKENAAPSDPNSLASPSLAAKSKSPLPPRPPNPLKRKLSIDTASDCSASGPSDSGVQVVVRMRPPCKDNDEGKMIVQKISSNSLSINGQNFTFDSVADSEATQLDIFELVGAPLVENCMAGFNSSVFAYGQTGSGKTYTMWGPANALLEENVPSDQHGLTPRVLERLFARTAEEQIKQADKQLKYQCHCSLLEIYNEQITDLLDPTQRNLQIREDVKTGIYVENLREECVYTMKDVTQLLIKGYSNRRTGETSINAESSRSHTVFTCVVESRCKSVADGMSSFKSSRINLVDLAGSERQKSTAAAGERLKEAGNINRSLSQLGNLINILAEISQSGKQRHVPYRDSRLTFLLQESLGGNAKLAVVCAISPTHSSKSETFSTLRFAKCVKAIKNKAVVNEVMQDDVNHLREVIRQLRDELHRIKANGLNPVDSTGGHSAAWIRRSLNIIRSLSRPITLPHADEDGDEEMEIDGEAVENLCIQGNMKQTISETIPNKADAQIIGSDGGSSNRLEQHKFESECDKEKDSEDLDINMEEGISEQEEAIIGADCEESTTRSQNCNVNLQLSQIVIQESGKELDTMDRKFSQPSNCENNDFKSSATKLLNDSSCRKTSQNGFSCPDYDVAAYVPVFVGDDDSPIGPTQCVSPSLSMVPSDASPVQKSPIPSVSPKLSPSRKSSSTSPMLTVSRNDLIDDKVISKNMPVSPSKSLKRSSILALSSEKVENFLAPTEHMAASIHHGLEIIDTYRQSSVLRRSSFRFPSKLAESKLTDQVCKADAGVQTISEIQLEDSMEFLCAICKGRMQLEGKETNETTDSSKLQLVPVRASESADKLKMQVPKAVEKVLAGAIRREMALEDLCAKQNSEIVKLNRLMQQYKHERECNSIIMQTREDKILRLENLMDGILPTEDFLHEELLTLKHEYKLLKENYENHPEVLRTKIELKRVQDELENLQSFYDMGEREVLLEEIQDLRSQLHHYVDTLSTSRKQNSLIQLTFSYDPSLTLPLSTTTESTKESANDRLEMERRCWNEAETKWISVFEELRSELEASKSLAEKRKHEFETEKKCAEELKEAMQLAMEGHARLLEQYVDLEEKHMQLLARHRKIQEGTEDVKKAAARAGVRGPESKFINVLAAEISVLRVQRERERRYLKDENKGLQAQLRDTAEAVQAAGELLLRLKEAEEAVATAQAQAAEAKQETKAAYKEINKLRKKQKMDTIALNDPLAESHRDTIGSSCSMEKYDVCEPHCDERWREEFEPFYNGELSKLADSWCSGYDSCNI